MKDFFVSYNGKDKTWAEWVAWQLEEAGYTTIIQAWDFRPGGNFALDMQQAAEQAERTIAVLSQNYLDALYTQPEWAAAFAQDPTGMNKTLLPVRVQECELKGMWSQIVYIDLVGVAEAQAKETLLTGLQVGRAKPTTAPGFPGSGTTAPAQLEKPPFPDETSSAPPQLEPVPTPTPPIKLAMNLPALRRQLNQMFDDAELDVFCMDNFPQVYDKFSRGMRKDENISLLLDYCRRVPIHYQRLLTQLEGQSE